MKKTTYLLTLVLSVMTLSACGKNSGAKANLEFASHNSAATGARVTESAETGSTYAASTFKMKMIAAYVAADIDPVTGNNVGDSEMIWLNPVCGTDIMHCDVSGGKAEDGAPYIKIVSDFFDFTSTLLANASLNSQNRDIQVGTYKYVRLEFCKLNQESVPNVTWASTAAGVNDEVSYSVTNCVVNSVVFDPPMSVKAGNTVTISVDYDLAGLVTTSASNGANCSNGQCFNLPTFTPSATVQ
jgi:hypothetical protein